MNFPTFLLLLSVLQATVSSGQTRPHSKQPAADSTAFSLFITTFNHAELMNGIFTYILRPSSIEVRKTPYGAAKSKLVYLHRLSRTNALFAAIREVRLDTLKDFYTNQCVMMTSGTEYYLNLQTGSASKTIALHHYYLWQVDALVQLINSKLPAAHQLRYLGKDTEQDCTLEQLIHSERN